MQKLIGQSLGRYHITEQLGEGGMATVYKAYDTRLERDVALKIIRKEAIPPEQLDRILKRFEREAMVLALMSHPNIVKVYESGEFNGSPFLVMELVTGSSLKEKPKPMHFRQAITLLIPIAEGLGHAHLKGILHRDVKPSNILINTNGKPMLVDFGIAKVLDEIEGVTLTGTGVGIGTPEYMAPEQGLGKEVDGRADVYSMGVVLYELLTAKKPYTADTPLAVIIKQINDSVPSPRMINREIPVALEGIIYKALQKQPENRHPKMEDLILDLKRILVGGMTTGSLVSGQDNQIQKKDIKANAAMVDADLVTRDDYQLQNPISSPELHVVVQSELQKKSLTKYFVILGGLFGIIFGIVLIYYGMKSISGSRIFQAEPTEVVLSPNNINSTSIVPAETHLLTTDTPVQISTAIDSIPIFDENVIQISNIQELNEINRWNIDSYGFNPFISWESNSSAFFLASFGYGYSRFNIPTRSVEKFRTDMRNIYMSTFSPGGLSYGTTGRECNQITFWRHGTNEFMYSIKGESGFCETQPHFSPDGQLLATVFDDSIILWNANNGSQITVLQEELGLSAYTGGDLVSVFSSDSKYFAAGKTKTGEIKIWDISTYSLISTIHWHEGLQSLNFSPDNTMLVSGSYSYTDFDVIRLWDVTSGNLVNNIQKNNEKIRSVSFSLDGQLIFSSSDLGAVRAWDVPWGKLVKTIANEGDSVYLTSISPDGKYLVTVGKDVVLYGVQ